MNQGRGNTLCVIGIESPGKNQPDSDVGKSRDMDEIWSYAKSGGLLTTEDAASLLGYSRRFLEARRQRGGGPRFIRISARSVRYRLADLEAWTASLTKQSTAES